MASRNSHDRRKSKPRTLQYIILRLGVPLAVATLGYGLMTSGHFLSGVILLYVGLLLLAVDVLYEFFRFRRWRFRAAYMGAWLATVIAASAKWIFIPAPLVIYADSKMEEYGPGSTINGIAWSPRFSELYFYVVNPTSIDYGGFEAEISVGSPGLLISSRFESEGSTGLLISSLKQISGLASCTIATAHPPQPEAPLQRFTNGKPVGPANDPSLHVEVKTVLVDKNGKMLLPLSGGDDSAYRIKCDEIPAKSENLFFAALEVLGDQKPDASGTVSLFGPPRVANWISVSATFSTNGRTRSISLAKCPMRKNCEAGYRTRVALQ